MHRITLPARRGEKPKLNEMALGWLPTHWSGIKLTNWDTSQGKWHMKTS